MYVNTLITLQENLATYAAEGKKVTGHVTINSPGMIKCYIQNLRGQESGREYAFYAFSKIDNKAVRVGKLSKNKETKWMVNERSVEGSGIKLEDLDAVAIVAEDSMRGVDTVAMGFKSNRYIIIPLIDEIVKKMPCGKQKKEELPKNKATQEIVDKKASINTQVDHANDKKSKSYSVENSSSKAMKPDKVNEGHSPIERPNQSGTILGTQNSQLPIGEKSNQWDKPSKCTIEGKENQGIASGMGSQGNQTSQGGMMNPGNQISQGGMMGQGNQTSQGGMMNQGNQTSQGGMMNQENQTSQGGMMGQGNQTSQGGMMDPGNQSMQGGMMGQGNQTSQGGMMGQGNQTSQGGMMGQGNQTSQGGMMGQGNQTSQGGMMGQGNQTSQGGMMGQGNQSMQGGMMGQGNQSVQGGMMGQGNQSMQGGMMNPGNQSMQGEIMSQGSQPSQGNMDEGFEVIEVVDMPTGMAQNQMGELEPGPVIVPTGQNQNNTPIPTNNDNTAMGMSEDLGDIDFIKDPVLKNEFADSIPTEALEDEDAELVKIAEKLKEIETIPAIKKSKKSGIPGATVAVPSASAVREQDDLVDEALERTSNELKSIISRLSADDYIRGKIVEIEEQIEKISELPQENKTTDKSRLEETLEARYTQKQENREETGAIKVSESSEGIDVEAEDELKEDEKDTSPRSALSFIESCMESMSPEDIESDVFEKKAILDKSKKQSIQEEIDYISEIDKKIQEIEERRRKEKNME